MSAGAVVPCHPGLSQATTMDIGNDDQRHVEEDSDESDPVHFSTRVRIDTPVEVDYYRNGGILHTVLKEMATH